MKNEEASSFRSPRLLVSSSLFIRHYYNLLVLYYLCHEFGFAYHLFAYKHIAFHCRYATTYGSHQLDPEDEGVSRDYFLAEFHAVYLQEVGGVAFGSSTELSTSSPPV